MLCHVILIQHAVLCHVILIPIHPTGEAAEAQCVLFREGGRNLVAGQKAAAVAGRGLTLSADYQKTAGDAQS